MKIVNQFMLDYPSRSKARGGTIYKIVFVILPVFLKERASLGVGKFGGVYGVWGVISKKVCISRSLDIDN
jgi:hypothetical protein